MIESDMTRHFVFLCRGPGCVKKIYCEKLLACIFGNGKYGDI